MDNPTEGNNTHTQTALTGATQIIEPTQTPPNFSTEIEVVADTQLEDQSLESPNKDSHIILNNFQHPTNTLCPNEAKQQKQEKRASSSSSDEPQKQEVNVQPETKPQLTQEQVQMCREIMSSQEHQLRLVDSPLSKVGQTPQKEVEKEIQFQVEKQCIEPSPVVVKAIVDIVDNPVQVQEVKLTKIAAKSQPEKKASISTKLVFVKNLEEKPKKGGYFQSKIVHISPTKKEDDPLSVHNLLLKQVPSSRQPLNIQLLPGEQVLISEDASLLGDKGGEGKLIFTNYRLSFACKQVKLLDIPLGYIGKLQRTVETRPVVYSTIDVTLKIGTVLRFKFISVKEISANAFKVMGKFVYCQISEVFAFNHAKAKNYTQVTKDPRQLAIMNGWDVYDWMKEYKRMNIVLEGDTAPFKVINNTQGKVCVSYPPYFIIPIGVTDDIMRKCMRTRSRDRIPALSYAIHIKKQGKFVCLWRSSHVKLNANTPRNLGDEEYVLKLGSISSKDPKFRQKNLVIFDIKHRLNAVGMMVNSSSRIPFPIENYRNAALRTIQYENLSHLRDSYNKVVAACCLNQTDKWLSMITQSKWYDSVFALIRDALLVVDHLQNSENVLIQCAEGYDRTPQISALAQIMLDPYYRTLEGFAVLVEKEFTSFGHPFNIRLGMKRDKENDERAPVFIQFLDAVNQLVKQFPLSFEFTSKYLARIAYELYSNRYGNFLCSGYIEQVENKIYQQTLSIWNELLLENNNLYMNAYYLNAKETDMYELRPSVSAKMFHFFRQHFFKLTSTFKDDYHLNQEAEENLDYFQVLHREVRQQLDNFRKQTSEQQIQISRLQAQLKALQESST